VATGLRAVDDDWVNRPACSARWSVAAAGGSPISAGVIHPVRHALHAPYGNTARWMAIPGIMGGMGEKRCSRCGELKPLAKFSRAAHGRDGRAAHCKDCHSTLYRLPLERVPVLTCFYCGKQFPNPARRGLDRKFCSPDCKDRWWREEYGRRRQAAPRGRAIGAAAPWRTRPGSLSARTAG
jgi:hypothetical protein